MKTTDETAMELPPPPSQSLWQALKDAIRGTEADYTKIDLRRAIFLLAVPMIIELLGEVTFALVDMYFVAKLGPSAIASVGLTESYLYLLYAVAMGLATGVTAIVARRIGEQDREGAQRAAIQSIFLGLLFSVPFAIVGIFFSRDLLVFMEADAWMLEHGYRYTQWMLVGNATAVLLFVLNAVFRGAGDAAIAMRVLWIANIINMALDPILIFGLGPIPAFGIEGAAIATNVGRGIGVLIQLWTLFNAGKHIRPTLAQVRWHGSTALQVMKTSLGGIGQMIVGMTSWIFLVYILSRFGEQTVAGATVALRVMMFAMMPAWGLSNAAATLVGQNLGAGHPERAESSIWKIGVYNMMYMILSAIAFYTLDEELIGLFTEDATVIAVGAEWLQILSYSFFVYGWWMVSTQAFNGSGDTQTPTKINLVFFWLIQIPLCYFLAMMLEWEASGVFWGVFISETSVGLFTLWLFTRGKWKAHKV